MPLKATLTLPAEFSNDDSAVVQDICVRTGQEVAAGQTLMTLEFSKAAVEMESPADGFVRLECEACQEVFVGDLLASVWDTSEEALGLADAPAPEEARPETAATAAPILSRAARELIGSGRIVPASIPDKDFVRARDLDAGQAKRPEPAAKSPASHSFIPPGRGWPPSNPEPLSFSKKLEATSLLAGQNAATSNFRCLLRLDRASPGNTQEKAFFSYVSAEVVPAILRNACVLLKLHRHLNARHEDGCIHFYDGVSLGYALDLGQGLRVACLGDLEGRPSPDIRRQTLGLIKKYMAEGLSPGDMAGTTFTVTDVSALNVAHFTPLIPAGHSAILGVCSPGADGAMALSLTFDHRVTEGRVAATFLSELERAVRKDLAASGVHGHA
jgi:pyruvate/2-oxoglutarate dehydrogenase complex dihydrolipoamide acyltransferase (E2) component